MSDDQDRLSAARRVEGLNQKPNALDQQKPASADFDRARDPMIAKQLDDIANGQQRAQGQPQGSRQVSEAAPAMRPTPPPGTAEVDRAAHRARQAQDDAAARLQSNRDRFSGGNQAKETTAGERDQQTLDARRAKFGDAARPQAEQPGQAQAQGQRAGQSQG